MDAELSGLYQDVILDRYKHPRNRGTLPVPPARRVAGYNPLCGDQLTVYLQLDGDRVQDVRLEGSGCAISVASGSIMSELLRGKTVAEVRALFTQFQQAVTGHGDGDDAALGKLAVCQGVAGFPARVKCATLAWHTLIAALDGQQDDVTTE